MPSYYTWRKKIQTINIFFTFIYIIYYLITICILIVLLNMNTLLKFKFVTSIHINTYKVYWLYIEILIQYFYTKIISWDTVKNWTYNFIWLYSISWLFFNNLIDCWTKKYIFMRNRRVIVLYIIFFLLLMLQTYWIVKKY